MDTRRTARTRLAASALLLACSLAAASDAARAPARDLQKMRAFAVELLVAGHYEDAIATFITIAEQAHDDPRSHYDVAGAMVFLRMWPDAIAPIQRAIALAPDNVLYHELAAMTYLQMQDFPNAFEATRRGAQLGDMKAMYTLAGMYEHGRGTPASPDKALEWLERAARAGHMGAMDSMMRVYRDGLYGQAPNAARERAWRQELARAMAR